MADLFLLAEGCWNLPKAAVICCLDALAWEIYLGPCQLAPGWTWWTVDLAWFASREDQGQSLLDACILGQVLTPYIEVEGTSTGTGYVERV